MPTRVLIPEDIDQAGKDFLQSHGYELVFGSGTTEKTLRRELVMCEALLLRTAHITSAVLADAPKLKVIAKHGIGVDNVDLEAASRHGIWVTNAPLSNADTVAEHALALILALARNLIRADRAVRSGDFGLRNRLYGSDLKGKTLGVVGVGRIGRALARKASLGFEMKVLAFDPYITDQVSSEVNLVSWDALFREADFVSLHLPLTPGTRGLVGEREFSLMKKSANLVSAARGEIIDEKALVTALQEGRIAGAGLDVFELEPPAPDNPLLMMDNVVLTPHNAALTEEATARMALHAAMGIHEVLSGQEPTWPVNRPKLESHDSTQSG